jgi:aerobic carbon-monoxide dehydrogenase large subunit
MATRIFGSGIKRREDPRLITGQAKYTDDLTLPGMVYMHIVRSPYAHANIRGINTEKAASMPGVVGVFTGQDIANGGFGNIPCAWIVPDSECKAPPHPPLASEKVRHVGDGVVAVVAEDPYLVRDAADAVEIDYEPLPAVVDALDATKDGAPLLYTSVPNNIDFRWEVKGGDVEKAFGEADVVVRERIINQRLIPNAIEPRSALAQYNSGLGDLTLWTTSQNPHIVRYLLSLVTEIPEHKIRVVAPEVGGGFGSKIPLYADEIVAIFCAKQLGRPVKWTETRSENYQTTIHGRDHIQEVELCGTREGKITGIRGNVWANLGAYLSTASTGIPTILHGLMLSGSYDIPNINEVVYGVVTNTTPVDAYRGAGRPEATFIVERLVDLFSREVGMDPAEVRRKNFIPPFEDGHTVATGLIYDSGDYEPALDKALEMVGYQQLRAEQANGPKDGKYLGIGLCAYTEICGLGPSQVAGAVGFGGGLWESAIVRFHPSGKVNLMVGVSPHGQGEETTFAQIISEELGVPIDDIEVIHGDTDQTPMGWGTYGSRTTAVASGAMMGAINKIKDKSKIIAAHMLEADVADIEYADGKFFVKGTPDQAKTIQDIALAANVAWDLPGGVEPGLEAASFFDPPNFVYPFGAHVAVVEVDSETGDVNIRDYVAVDDCGRIINPMIVEGQIHGGLAQGIGQALWEAAVYDENGQLLSGTMMDYAIPRASFFPKFRTDKTETPTNVNPLGVKGIGETGTIASTAAVYNAVMDALAPLGVTKIEMPLKPERIWKAIQGAQNGG